MYKGVGGQEGRGVGWVLGVGGKPEAGYTLHWDTGSSAVCSISDKNRHSRQDRPRRSLAAVWYHMHPY